MRWAWVILLASFGTFFVNYSIRIGAYSVLLPEMVQDLGINMTQAGMVRAAYFFTYILFAPLIGWLTDRIGARLVISFSCVFLGGGAFLMGQTTSLFTAILFHGVIGIGSAAMWTPILTLIQKWFGDMRRGLALGILSPSWALGYGLMGVVLPLIVKTYTLRTGWILLGISGLVLVVMNALFLRSDAKEIGLFPWGDTSESLQAHSLPHSSFRYRDILQGSHF